MEIFKDIFDIFSSSAFVFIVGFIFLSYKRNEIIYKKDIFTPLGYSNKYLINPPKLLKIFSWIIVFLLILTTSLLWITTYLLWSINIFATICFLIMSIILTVMLLFQIFFALTLNYHNNYELPLIKYNDDDYYIIAKNSDDTYIIQKCELYKKSENNFELIDIKDISKFKLVNPE